MNDNEKQSAAGLCSQLWCCGGKLLLWAPRDREWGKWSYWWWRKRNNIKLQWAVIYRNVICLCATIKCIYSSIVSNDALYSNICVINTIMGSWLSPEPIYFSLCLNVSLMDGFTPKLSEATGPSVWKMLSPCCCHSQASLSLSALMLCRISKHFAGIHESTLSDE